MSIRKMSQMSSERIERIEKLVGYLKKIRDGIFELPDIMKLHGYDVINNRTLNHFIDDIETRARGEYTLLKFKQGEAIVADLYLKSIYNSSTFVNRPYVKYKFGNGKMDELLYSAYWERLVEEISDSIIPDEEINYKNCPVYFLEDVINDAKNIFTPSSELLNDEEYRTFILNFATKYFSKELEQSNFDVSNSSVENCEVLLQKLLPDFIIDKRVTMPGITEYNIRKRDGDTESIVNFFSGDVNVKDVVGVLKSLEAVGIELSDGQKQIVTSYERRKELGKNVENAVSRNMEESERRIEWQNDPNHPDNIRKEKLEEAKEILKSFNTLKNSGLLSKQQEQDALEYDDFVNYSRKPDERNIGPMSDEVRQKMTEYYTNMEAEQQEQVASEHDNFANYSRNPDERNIGPMPDDVRQKMIEYYTNMEAEATRKSR